MNENEHNRAFNALLSAFFVNFLGYAFIVPILPSWQTQFDMNATQSTLLVSLWAVPMFLFGPWTGRLADRFGAGQTIFACILLLSSSSLLYLIATEWDTSHPVLLLGIARLLHGASGAAIMTAGLAAASQIWPTNFGEKAGALLGIGAVGGLFGPVLGGLLFTAAKGFAFQALALITLIAAPFVYLSRHDITSDAAPAQGNVSIAAFFKDPVLLRVGILLTMTTVATGALEAGVPLFLDDSLKLSSAAIGGILLAMVLMQGIGSFLWGKFVDRNGPTRYMLLGWLLVVFSLIGVSVTGLVLEGKSVVLAIIVLLALFQFSIAAAQIPMLPIIDAASHRTFGEGNPGLAFGMSGTAWAAGTIIGPLLVGPVFDWSNSWPIALGILAIPTAFALYITFSNRTELTRCYESEIERRKSQSP